MDGQGRISTAAAIQYILQIAFCWMLMTPSSAVSLAKNGSTHQRVRGRLPHPIAMSSAQRSKDDRPVHVGNSRSGASPRPMIATVSFPRSRPAP
jgi:hypothetical protein